MYLLYCYPLLGNKRLIIQNKRKCELLRVVFLCFGCITLDIPQYCFQVSYIII